MLADIKALIVVLTLAAPVFYLAKPIALRFMSEADFSLRRRLWFVLAATCFMSPNFWLYLVIAVPTLIWAVRKDSNPVALYLSMSYVIPPFSVNIPILGNNGLFPLDNFRVLAFCVLLPASIRFRRTPEYVQANAFGAMDILLLAFGALQVALYTPPDLLHHYIIPDSPTNEMRRAFLFLLDAYLLYFTVSRICNSRQKLRDAIASFCLVCAVMAAISMFERAKGWLLFVDLATRLGNDPGASFYLIRGGSVRAQASTGHSIALGTLLAVAFGFWLYLWSHVPGKAQRIGVTLLLWGGLIGAFSRGGFLAAASIYFTFIVAGPNPVSRFMKGTCIALIIAGVIAVSPLGDQILGLLPQTGAPADAYRHQLAERGWAVALEHPFFGNQFPWPEMEDLRQGQGIIDLVNTYLSIALGYGLVGLVCFLGFILLGMARTYGSSRALRSSDPDLSLLGTSLVASSVGFLIILDSSSFTLGPAKLFYVLAGFMAAYARLPASPRRRVAAVSADHVAEGRT